MKKILAIILAAVMIAACSVTAFAETTNVSYNVDPSYTVSIPAAVTLGDSAVEADITASDVILEGGKKIAVELTSASNTASGSTFNAKNGDSTVTYTITGDKAIAVGDTVATFMANGSKTLTFSAADKSAATVAGAHTETLTFDISVESTVTRTVTWNPSDIVPEHPWDDFFTKDGITITAATCDFDQISFWGGGTFTTTLGNFTKIEISADYAGDVSGTGWTNDGWQSATWTGNAASVSFSGDIWGGGMTSQGGNLTIKFTIEG